ncbi:MAG: PAS domain-containing protein [Acetobacteraceae bacterium]|nr:PAS domain-containing protein [Acetobacteraceae bacterium]
MNSRPAAAEPGTGLPPGAEGNGAGRPRPARGAAVLLLPAAFLLPLLMVVAAGWLAWRDAWRDAEVEMAGLAEAGAEYARRRIEGMLLRADMANSLLHGLSDAEIRTNEAALHARLQALPEWPADTGAVHLFVHDRDGRSLVSGRLYPAPADRDFMHREFNQALRAPDAPRAHVSPTYLGEATGRRYFAVSRRREGAANGLPPGAYDGVVVAAVDVAGMAEGLRHIMAQGRGGDAVALIRLDGEVLVREPDPGHAPARLALRGDIARAAADGSPVPRGVTYGPSGVDGVVRLAVSRRVEGWPLLVTAARPRGAILAQWREAVALPLAVGVAATFALAVLALLVRRGQARLAAANARLEHDVAARTVALAESEARLHRTQRIGRVGGFEIDLRSGANRRSPEYMDLQGRTPEETIESHADWVARLHPEDRERAERRFLDAIADDAPDVEYAQEYRIVAPDGETRWIAARAEIERDPRTGRALRMLGAHLDVTALKAAEARLGESQRRGREVLESLGEILYALDARGRIEFASRCALEMWNRRAEAVLGWHVLDVFPVVRGSVAWAAIQEVMRTGTALHLCALSPLFGRWFEYGIHPAAGGGVTVAARDVHDWRESEIERRRAEAAQRNDAERLRLVRRAAGIGVFEWHVPSGRLSWCEETCRILGIPPERRETTIDTWRRHVLAEDWPRLRQEVRAAVAARAPSLELAYRIRRGDGAVAHVEGAAALFYGTDGGLLRVVGINQDVTERRLAEARRVLLTYEVDHRAKNALAVVDAMLRLTPRDSVERFAEAVGGRVRALARTHGLLATHGWAGVPLETLARAEFTDMAHEPLPPVAPWSRPPGSAPPGSGPPGSGPPGSGPPGSGPPESGPPGSAAPDRHILSGPAVILAPAAVHALAMVLHEMAAESRRHGALAGPAGGVALCWDLAEPALLRLRWEERGAAPHDPADAHTGFGWRLIEGAVRHQLGGRIERRGDATGMAYVIEMPLERALAEPGSLPAPLHPRAA